MARQLLHKLFGVYFGIVFFVLTIPSLLLVAVTPGYRRRRRIARMTAKWIFRFSGISLTTSGLDNLPDNSSIVVANHASYLDGVVLTAALPPVFSFVIKREVTSVPGMHLMLRRLGSQFVERFDHRRGVVDARRVLRSAHSGQALAFFPEGTFRQDPGLRRFHAGAFVAAARAGLPVVPVAIQGTRAILPSGTYWTRPGRITVTIMEPIPAGARDNEAVPALRDAARQALLEVLEEPDVTHKQADPR